jgi:predicted GIY-YIG superfamily endonuclease
LGYPSKIIYTQKEKALKHSKKEIVTINPAFPVKTMYFTSTRNEVTSGKEFHTHIKRVFEILKESPYFKRVVHKLSFRQQPSLSSSLIIKNSGHKHPEPVKCKENACKICPLLFTGTEWKSNCGLVLRTARATCCSHYIIYIMIEKASNEVLYIGQTAQKMNTRVSKHRNEKTWMRKSKIKVIPIPAPIKAVHRIEKEQRLIKKLCPIHNKQTRWFWWQGESHYAHHN